MYEITSHKVDVNGVKVHYTEAGAGDPIIMIHGFPTSYHLWRNVMPGIAKTHRAIAIDLPGYGRSDKPLDIKYNFFFYEKVLNGFLDELGLQESALAVHDIGGPIGVFWAIRNQQRLTKLVLLNTLVYPEMSWAVKVFMLSLMTPGVRRFVASPRGIRAALRFGVVHKARMTPEVLEPYTAPFEDPIAGKGLVRAGLGLSPKGFIEMAEKLSTLSVPIRIIYGENDRILPDVAKTFARVKQDCPQATITSLPGCGHFLQEDEPEQLAGLIAEFLCE